MRTQTQSRWIRFLRSLGLATLICNGIGVGCGSSPESPPSSLQSITVSGQGSFADGTPIVSRDVQYQLILDGAHLFQAGVNGCRPTPAHVAGTVIRNSSSTLQGQFSLNVKFGDLHAAVVKACAIQKLDLAQVHGATLRASVLADSTTCSAFCSGRGGPPDSTCVTGCQTGNRVLFASRTLTADSFADLAHGAANGNIYWTEHLVFDSLGPTLTPGTGADLLVDGDAALKSAHVDQEDFAASSCEIAEKCVRAPGPRNVLRFDGSIINLGSEDLVVGDPAHSPLFTPSSCHNVPLLKNIMLYELVDPATGQVVQVDNQAVVGRKQGFCMIDITQMNASAPHGLYSCDNQGITRGWEDTYDADLDCQFLDVTGVPAGDYTLRITVNPDHLFQESDYSNNSAEVPVKIPAQVPKATTNL